MNPLPNMIDDGFSIPYSSERITALESILNTDSQLHQCVEKFHNEDGSLDLKRGEMYPEILRATITVKELAAQSYEISSDQVQPNFGSNGSIDTILSYISTQIATPTNRNILVSTPTYFRIYASSHARNLNLLKIPLKNSDWTFDLEKTVEALKKHKPRGLYLVTPNNPTGIAISDDHLKTTIEAASPETVVIVDRTLANTENEISTKELLKQFQHRNLVVLHSLSKYYGQSHLRMGIALYSNLKLAGQIAAFLPLGIGFEGLIAASFELLKGPLCPGDVVQKNIRENKSLLRTFAQEFESLSVTNFSGNYCLFSVPTISSIEINAYLNKKGIFTMGGHQFPDANLNINRLHTGGEPDKMLKFIDSLKRMVR